MLSLRSWKTGIAYLDLYIMTENQILSWPARSNLVDNHFAIWSRSCYLSTFFLEKYVIIKSQIEADGAERAWEEVLFHRMARREEKRKEEGETAAVIR